jgi:hypothetical protein
MKSILTATTAGLLVLVFTATAPAQPGSNYSGGSYYGVPSQQYVQPVYPSNYYAQPQFSGSFNYSSPSFGLGINVNPSYGSSYGIYSQPYAPTSASSPRSSLSRLMTTGWGRSESPALLFSPISTSFRAEAVETATWENRL